MSRHLERVFALSRVGMGSPGHFSEDARLQIVRAAGNLFHNGGAESTTIHEVVEAAGVTKAEFRQHFRCKLELVSAVLRSYFEKTAADIGPLKYDLNTWSDVQECLASHVEFQKKFKMTRGCPIGTLGSELKEGDESTRQSLGLILNLMLTRFESFFSREKVAGRLAGNVDVEQLANFSVAIIQGAMLAGKIRGNCRCVESTFEDLLSHLKRYAKVPTAPGKRPGRGRKLLQRSTLPKAPMTVVKLYDSQNPGEAVENHLVDQSCPEDEAEGRLVKREPRGVRRGG